MGGRRGVCVRRGVLKGEASITLAAELQVSPQTLLDLRREVRQRPLSDTQTETDEMFQNAGEKR